LRRSTTQPDESDGKATEKGFVLLVVLWVLTSAVLLVTSFNGAIRSGAASAVSELGLSQSEALLDAGVEIAAAHLIDGEKKPTWIGDGTPHRLSFAGANFTITISDANGLVDLNKSDGKLLRTLFQKFTNSPMKAARYADIVLRARDAVSAKSDTGGDRAAGNVTEPVSSDVAFIDVSQLARMEGIPRHIFDQVAPYLTIYSEDGTIYPAAAPAELLRAIPIVAQIGIEKVLGADKSALVGMMGDAPAFLAYESGHAHLVTVRVHRPDDDYSVARKYVIATAIDPSSPYRLMAKWPLTTSPAENRN
jgi:general secretion pathway protein K